MISIKDLDRYLNSEKGKKDDDKEVRASIEEYLIKREQRKQDMILNAPRILNNIS